MTVLNEARRLVDAALARARVRDGRPGDATALLALFSEAFDERAAGAGLTPRAAGEVRLLLGAARLLGSAAPLTAAVAELDGEVVAAACASRRGPAAARVEGIATTGEWCGEGLGTRVYEHLFRRLRSQGVRRLYADIEPWNAGALRFHRRLGFDPAPGFEERPLVRRVYRWVREYRGHLGPWTPLNMARPLAPEDAPALAALFAQRYGQGFVEAEGLDAQALAGPAAGAARLLDRLGRGTGLALAAGDADGAVTGGAVAAYAPGASRLAGLVVRDGDEGVAMALLHTLLYGLQRRGVRRLVADVPAGDGWLDGVLARAGFEAAFRHERLYRYGEIRRAPDLELVRYRRDL